ncbi:MAG TPA: oxidoreductase [Solimonas sp.]|nr:oxidoreductase [Solimonas sp.]
MNWNTDQIPDQSGKLALVTGGNSGIGYWTCLHLARKGARVVMACRSQARAQAALDKLQAAVPQGQFEILLGDLTDLKSVRDAADNFRSRHQRLDILCLNAGIALAPMARTKDGFESHIGANFLGHFAFTGHLLDMIRATPGCRVIHVASIAHHIGRIDLQDLNFERRPYRAWAAYAQSKLANLMFMLELERRFRRAGIDAISLGGHPGMALTNVGSSIPIFTKPGFRSLAAWIQSAVPESSERGAGPMLLAATMPEAKGGSYFGPDGWMEIQGAPAPAKISAAASEALRASRLWKLAEGQTGVRYL